VKRVPRRDLIADFIDLILSHAAAVAKQHGIAVPCPACERPILPGQGLCPRCLRRTETKPRVRRGTVRPPSRQAAPRRAPAAPGPTLYDLLEVSPQASPETITAAWKALAKKHHPDHQPGRASEETMKRINAAHEVLSDSQRRREYDMRGQ
jgi:hypothetical protein